jgi:hypothetical protein
MMGIFLLLSGIAFADPWITDGSTATARYNLAIPAAYTMTSLGTITGEQLTSSDDASVTDDLSTGDDAFFGGDVKVNTLWVNTTSDFLKEMELSVAVDRTSYEISTDTAISDTNIPGLYFVGSASANQTITLPTASAADGCSLTFIVKANVGSYNVVVDGKSAETINGAATKTNSDQYSVLEVTSDGTAWYISDSIGTWT